MGIGRRAFGVFSASFALVTGMVVSIPGTSSAVQASATHAALTSKVIPSRSSLSRAAAAGSGLVAVPAGSAPRGVAAVGEFSKLRTANSRTYLTRSGRRVTTVFPGAVNYLTSSKVWAPIRTAAVANRSGWSEAGNSWQALLPRSLSSPVTVTSGAERLSMGLVGAHAVGRARRGAPSGIGGRCGRRRSATPC